MKKIIFILLIYSMPYISAHVIRKVDVSKLTLAPKLATALKAIFSSKNPETGDLMRALRALSGSTVDAKNYILSVYKYLEQLRRPPGAITSFSTYARNWWINPQNRMNTADFPSYDDYRSSRDNAINALNLLIQQQYTTTYGFKSPQVARNFILLLDNFLDSGGDMTEQYEKMKTEADSKVSGGFKNIGIVAEKDPAGYADLAQGVENLLIRVKQFLRKVLQDTNMRSQINTIRGDGKRLIDMLQGEVDEISNMIKSTAPVAGIPT